ncbi:hypothetical protein [Oricola sp.]|uniref:hypothetical protein n=1 Tax=Oricola sp. TaxID=1979950 RepID=UPI003BAB55BA
MGKGPKETTSGPSGTLGEAIRQIRLAAAERADVVVELRETDRARLELLAHELADVIEEVPVEDDRFDFAISSGLQPRFWIDATAHVAMGRDRRTYRFVRDTRLGRVVLAETPDRVQVAARVTVYIAERVHERELVLAGETFSARELASGRAIGHENTSLLQGQTADGEVPPPADRLAHLDSEVLAGLAPRRRNLADARTRKDRQAAAPAASPEQPFVAETEPAATAQPEARRKSNYGIALFSVVVIAGAAIAWRYRDAIL